MRSKRAVTLWLWGIALAIVVQVSLGGITRLTDSGLSITEWKPLLGVLPPTDAAGWQSAFESYQQIPQSRTLKASLTLDEFKVIYFWEWLHRLWGRLVGLAFALPVVAFFMHRRFDGLRVRLVALSVLFGLQGVMGWVMVMSGLQDRLYVSHLRLAAHLVLAMVLLGGVVWVALETRPVASRRSASVGLRFATWAMLGGVLLQLTLGAFMAGLRAALLAPTWPSINGQWWPTVTAPWWNDALAVHLAHRSLAYALSLATVVWWWHARHLGSASRHVALGLVFTQVVLGILATTRSVYAGELLVFGVLHQLVGVALFIFWVVTSFQVRAQTNQNQNQAVGSGDFRAALGSTLV